MVSIAKKQVRNQKVGRVVVFIFFSIFALVGAGLLYPFGIRPVLKTIAAEKWQETPCRIISAEVGSHHSDDGTTYSIDTVYEYEFNGSKYRSERYDFFKFSSSGYKNKARVVDKYKNDANPVCFVNPENPSEAVLRRGFHLGLLTALFPLPFLAAGVGGLVWVVKNSAKRGTQPWLLETQKESTTGVLRVTDDFGGPVILKTKTSPWVRLVGAFLIAAFWNGIVSVFIINIIRGWSSGQWGLMLFMIPFVLVGLAIIGGVIYCFLAVFNPRPKLIISSSQISPGDSVHIDWHFSGRVERIRTLSILLRAKEEATYKAGKNQHTETNVFFQKEIYSGQSPDIGPIGEANFDIPAEVMHSFEANHNKIVWEITVRGSIESWPDVRDDFKIIVTPAKAQQI